MLIIFFKMIQIKLNCLIVGVRSDHGTKFENAKIDAFCPYNGVNNNFLALITPQQNGVVERKNRTLVIFLELCSLNQISLKTSGFTTEQNPL